MVPLLGEVYTTVGGFCFSASFSEQRNGNQIWRQPMTIMGSVGFSLRCPSFWQKKYIATNCVYFFPSKQRNYRTEAPNGTLDSSVDSWVWPAILNMGQSRVHTPFTLRKYPGSILSVKVSQRNNSGLGCLDCPAWYRGWIAELAHPGKKNNFGTRSHLGSTSPGLFCRCERVIIVAL